MPTLDGTIQRLALNQAARVGTLEALSGERLILWQGLASNIQCALFKDTPEQSSLITNVSNVDSVHLVVRKHNSNGAILFSKEIVSGYINASLSYANWLSGAAQHFTFNVSTTNTTQVLPPSGHLPIFFVVTVTTDAAVDYVAGFGYGEIAAVGYVNNPVSEDYETGTTLIVGGKLQTDLDLNGFHLINSGDVYTEEGEYVLSSTPVTIPFTFTKPLADGYRFAHLYLKDSLGLTHAVVLKTQTTTGFTVSFDAGFDSGEVLTLYWKVAPKIVLPSPSPAPRFVAYNDDVLLHLQDTGILASKSGTVGDGVEDDGDALNAWLAGVPLAGLPNKFLNPGIFITNQQLIVPNSMDEGTIQGFGKASIIKAGPSFPTNKALIKGGTTIAGMVFRDIALNLNNRAAAGLDLTRTESSIRHKIQNIIVSNIPTNGKGFILDGCEDSKLEGCETVQQAGATGVVSVKWSVPGGNIWIMNGTFFNELQLDGQQIVIRDSTTGPINSPDAVTQILMQGVYGYANTGSTKANIYTSGGGVIYSLVCEQCYFNPTNQNNVIALQGKFGFLIDLRTSVFDAAGNTGYVVMSSATQAATSFNPNFVVDNTRLLTGATVGVPAAGCTSNQWINATLQNSWTNIGAGYQLASFTKDRAGFVILRGNVIGGTTTTNTVVFTLPLGYRPATNVIHPVQSGAGVTAVTIDASGLVYLTFTSNSTISFSGIRFQAT